MRQTVEHGLVLYPTASRANGDDEQWERSDLIVLELVRALRERPVVGALESDGEAFSLAGDAFCSTGRIRA